MSAEETELTFIYCPGCRSLIPANASRCKMCGHALKSASVPKTEQQASAEVEENRPRQSTATLSSQEVERAHERETIKPVILSPAPTRAPAASQTTPPEQRQPSRQSNEFGNGQTRELPQQENRASSVSPSTTQRPAVDSGFRLGGRDRDVLQGEAKPVQIRREELPEASQSQHTSRPDSAGAGHEDENSERRRRRKKKKRRGGMGDDLVVNRTEPQRRDQQIAEAEPEDSFRSQESGAMSREMNREMLTPQESRPMPVEPRREVPVAHAVSAPERSFERQVERPQVSTPAPKAAAIADGVLVGWFVRWDGDGKGSSREIRSGRYFVSGERLRATDLVIAEANLSVPHCLMRATAGSLQIQDMMSEAGTYVSRASGPFESVDETFTVENGDIVRMGDFEVMVCLLPSKARP